MHSSLRRNVGEAAGKSMCTWLKCSEAKVYRSSKKAAAVFKLVFENGYFSSREGLLDSSLRRNVGEAAGKSMCTWLKCSEARVYSKKAAVEAVNLFSRGEMMTLE